MKKRINYFKIFLPKKDVSQPEHHSFLSNLPLSSIVEALSGMLLMNNNNNLKVQEKSSPIFKPSPLKSESKTLENEITTNIKVQAKSLKEDEKTNLSSSDKEVHSDKNTKGEKTKTMLNSDLLTTIVRLFGSLFQSMGNLSQTTAPAVPLVQSPDSLIHFNIANNKLMKQNEKAVKPAIMKQRMEVSADLKPILDNVMTNQTNEVKQDSVLVAGLQSMLEKSSVSIIENLFGNKGTLTTLADMIMKMHEPMMNSKSKINDQTQVQTSNVVVSSDDAAQTSLLKGVMREASSSSSKSANKLEIKNKKEEGEDDDDDQDEEEGELGNKKMGSTTASNTTTSTRKISFKEKINQLNKLLPIDTNTLMDIFAKAFAKFVQPIFSGSSSNSVADNNKKDVLTVEDMAEAQRAKSKCKLFFKHLYY
jgi:hypothetical protein